MYTQKVDNVAVSNEVREVLERHGIKTSDKEPTFMLLLNPQHMEVVERFTKAFSR